MTREELDKMILDSNPKEKDLKKYKTALLEWMFGQTSESRFRERVGYTVDDFDIYHLIKDRIEIAIFEVFL
jgi:Ni/Co efflux regulator RcnB